MKVYVCSDALPYETLRIEDREPECGVNFCDACGDCLHCYGGDKTCYRGGKDDDYSEHLWVVYKNTST